MYRFALAAWPLADARCTATASYRGAVCAEPRGFGGGVREG